MPTISILITTFNRKELVKRAIDSVLAQTYQDWELIVIDDASTDGTHTIIPQDSRIQYMGLMQNLGKEHGDRIHIQRFMSHAKGEYFIYLCSDDYWLPSDLLEREIALFNANPNLSMVIGGQEGHEKIFPAGLSSSVEFLEYFAERPITSNIITGATLFDREKFIKSGALTGEGSKWQAGFEIYLSAAQQGNVFYIDEPCVHTDIAPTNASFQGTQLEHYLDSVASVNAAFKTDAYKDIRERTIKNIGIAYLANADHIKTYGSLSHCSAENISRPVTVEDVSKVEA